MTIQEAERQLQYTKNGRVYGKYVNPFDNQLGIELVDRHFLAFSEPWGDFSVERGLERS